MSITICVVNESTAAADADVARMTKAVAIQVERDFAPIWGATAALSFVPKGATPPPGAWQVVVLDYSDQSGDLGYHETTDAGLPLGKVFAATDRQYGLQLSVTLSHEILEMLADPECTAFVSGPDGKEYVQEVCDPVEDDSDGYFIDIGDGGAPVLVSDFVTPLYFRPAGTAGEVYDFRKLLTLANPALLKGGYSQAYDPQNPSAGWVATYGERSPHDRARLPRGHHRHKLYAMPMAVRRRSTRWAA